MPAEYALTAFDHAVKRFHDGTVTTFRDDVDSPENAAYQAWLAVPNVPDPYTNTAIVGATIDKRQFWTQLALDGHISENEAVAAMGGDTPDIPLQIRQFINNTLPAPQRWLARMFFLSDSFERHNQAITHTKTVFALNDATMDQFFHDAALL
jgi:hypothetical protein